MSTQLQDLSKPAVLWRQKAPQQLGDNAAAALPGLHAFTGCDFVIEIAERGKKKAVNLIRSNPSLHVSEDVFTRYKEFVCSMYNKPGNDVKIALYKIFCTAKAESSQLPPC